MAIIKAIDLLKALEEIRSNDHAFDLREISVRVSHSTLDEVSYQVTCNDVFFPEEVKLMRDTNEIQIIL